ncbi:hypothetical protein ACFL42_04025 [Candidatus Omnitrophota bacterium]
MLNEDLLESFFEAGRQEAFAVIRNLTDTKHSVHIHDHEAGSLGDAEVVTLINAFISREEVLPAWKRR